jgi:hypothetical protein
MKYAVRMGSGVMIYTPRLINIGSGILKLLVRNRRTDQKEIA